MRNGRKYVAVALLTLVVVIVAALVSQQRAPETSRERVVLFPALAARINDIDELRIRDAQHTLTVRRRSDGWGIVEADHYPALPDKVKQTVLAVSDLEVVAEKTDNPELYEKLGVEDVDDKGATSTLLALVADGDELAGLILGNTRKSRFAAGAPGLYVRVPGQQRALLVAGRLSVGADIIQWFERNIINIEGERVHAVRLRPQGVAEVRLDRDDPADDLRVQDLPAGRQQQSDYLLGRIAGILENVYAEGVKKADSIDFSSPAAMVDVTTFDGLTATIEVADSGGQSYAQFSFGAQEAVADGTPAGDESPAATGTEEEDKPTPAQEAETLNRLLQGWAYQLSATKAELYTWTLEDLVRDPEQPTAEQDSSAE